MKNLYYGWIIVLIGTCVIAAHSIVFYGFGIFLRPITMEFNWERGALSAALSICDVIGGLLAILAGRLSDRYGPRLLVSANGLLTGIGFFLLAQINSLWQVYLIWGLLGIAGSGCFIPVVSTIPRWFAQKRGIAVGIVFAGFGVGGVITPPLTQWLISSYGWRQAYIILGLIIFIIITPLAQFMKHSPQRMGLVPYGESPILENKQSSALAMEGFSLKEAIRTGRFWFFCSLLFCFFFCVQVMLIHIVPYAVDIGMPAIVAAGILSLIAGSSIIGRFSIGFISDKIGARIALSACLILVALALIWLLFASTTWMFYLFAVLYGIAYGGVVPLQNLIPAELFGLKFLGIILAVILFGGAIGGAIAAPLAGYIFDVTGSYRLAFLICVILCALAVILSLILLRSKSKGGVLVTK